jgi:hypothetical protein
MKKSCTSCSETRPLPQTCCSTAEEPRPRSLVRVSCSGRQPSRFAHCSPGSAAGLPPRTAERVEYDAVHAQAETARLVSPRGSADLTSKRGGHPPSPAVPSFCQSIHWTFCAANRTGVIFLSQTVPNVSEFSSRHQQCRPTEALPRPTSNAGVRRRGCRRFGRFLLPTCFQPSCRAAQGLVTRCSHE